MKTLSKSNLNQFTGTSSYYKHGIGSLSIYLTDGTKYLCDEAQCYWLADVVLSYQTHKKVKDEPFQTWTLQKRQDDWLVTADDGNKNILVTQVIHYSDFPFDSIQLYFADNILLLPSEY
jgi:hypothetical protein